MMAGKPAFSGKSRASLMAAILEHDPPPVSDLRPTTPPALDRLVRTCLVKDPDARWQSAHDLAQQLRWMAEGRDEVATTGRRGPRALPLALAGALGALLAAGLIWLGRGRGTDRAARGRMSPRSLASPTKPALSNPRPGLRTVSSSHSPRTAAATSKSTCGAPMAARRPISRLTPPRTSSRRSRPTGV